MNEAVVLGRYYTYWYRVCPRLYLVVVGYIGYVHRHAVACYSQNRRLVSQRKNDATLFGWNFLDYVRLQNVGCGRCGESDSIVFACRPVRSPIMPHHDNRLCPGFHKGNSAPSPGCGIHHVTRTHCLFVCRSAPQADMQPKMDKLFINSHRVLISANGTIPALESRARDVATNMAHVSP